MTTSHPEYDDKTTATEVASAFAGSILGKNGEQKWWILFTT